MRMNRAGVRNIPVRVKQEEALPSNSLDPNAQAYKQWYAQRVGVVHTALRENKKKDAYMRHVGNPTLKGCYAYTTPNPNEHAHFMRGLTQTKLFGGVMTSPEARAEIPTLLEARKYQLEAIRSGAPPREFPAIALQQPSTASLDNAFAQLADALQSEAIDKSLTDLVQRLFSAFATSAPTLSESQLEHYADSLTNIENTLAVLATLPSNQISAERKRLVRGANRAVRRLEKLIAEASRAVYADPIARETLYRMLSEKAQVGAVKSFRSRANVVPGEAVQVQTPTSVVAVQTEAVGTGRRAYALHHAKNALLV